MKKYLSVLLPVFVFVTAMPAPDCAAIALQSVVEVTVSDTPALQVAAATEKVKKKPKTKVKAKDGEYEITVDRNAAKRYEEEEDSWFNKKYKKLSLKYSAQYILFGIIIWTLRLYNKKKNGK